ncbi:unnamed protein product [Caenorhabditis angaria]|uniref:Uncharacterized protein n=1 Tax=Caenorhabditis angaria TaxID=860376 RepID=A0A9P1MUE9_9PELO|nr:unnamed protein product [Caenorhabditis angaria]
MICEMQKDWKYRVEYVELDELKNHKILLKTEAVTVQANSTGPSFTRKFEGSSTDSYDLYMYITNTCTRLGNEETLVEFLGNVKIGTEEVRYDTRGMQLN